METPASQYLSCIGKLTGQLLAFSYELQGIRMNDLVVNISHLGLERLLERWEVRSTCCSWRELGFSSQHSKKDGSQPSETIVLEILTPSSLPQFLQAYGVCVWALRHTHKINKYF